MNQSSLSPEQLGYAYMGTYVALNGKIAATHVALKYRINIFKVKAVCVGLLRYAVYTKVVPGNVRMN